MIVEDDLQLSKLIQGKPGTVWLWCIQTKKLF